MGEVPEVISRYWAASEAGDVEAMMATLEPGAELISPLSGRMVFRGKADLRVLIAAVYGAMADLNWSDWVGEGRVHLLRGEGRIGPFRLGDAMVIELSERGLIARIRPHFRPWLGLTAFAIAVGPRLARHPGVIWRALRG